MTRIAVVLTTHNAEQWINDTLTSIDAQSRRPDEIVVIDDGSTDSTHAILAERGIAAIPATSGATDVITRIAANFVQGVRACAGSDLVVIGDHDDRWHPERVAHQAALFDWRPEALMAASDGRIVDSASRPTGGTVRDSFPVPADWDALTPADRMRYALRHSIATGGACTIRPGGFPDLTVPPGWLHDRWWSLVATVRDAMIVDPRPVIDYRVQDGQQVGLDLAAQQHGAFGRFMSLVGQSGRSWGKQRDIRRLLRPMAVDPNVAAVVSLRNVL